MSTESDIKPLPDKVGVGFQSRERQSFPGRPYREEQAGPVWRYHVVPDAFNWPVPCRLIGEGMVIDGFSPNLNKTLHVGHLRQLALANSVKRMLGGDVKFVSLLGCHGVLKKAQDELKGWFDFLDFKPELHYDVLMPQDEDWVARVPGEGKYEGAFVWAENKDVVLFRKADDTGYRRATYAYHDLAFAKLVGPTHYFTGSEQLDHFRTLGLGDKHHPVGLVSGLDGKKLSSRDGTNMTAKEAFAAVETILEPVPDPCKVAWNVLAYNLLATGRTQNVRFDPATWVKREAPGMYVSYTWARLHSALGGISRGHYKEMTQADAELAGYACYMHYWRIKAQQSFDPAPFANWLAELCRRVNRAWTQERIRDGRPGFQYAVSACYTTITAAMKLLGMFPVPLRVDDNEKTSEE